MVVSSDMPRWLEPKGSRGIMVGITSTPVCVCVCVCVCGGGGGGGRVGEGGGRRISCTISPHTALFFFIFEGIHNLASNTTEHPNIRQLFMMNSD